MKIERGGQREKKREERVGERERECEGEGVKRGNKKREGCFFRHS
jgi:hypothetical protein